MRTLRGQVLIGRVHRDQAARLDVQFPFTIGLAEASPPCTPPRPGGATADDRIRRSVRRRDHQSAITGTTRSPKISRGVIDATSGTHP